MMIETGEAGWVIDEDGFDPARANTVETLMTVGNGYLGTRGSLEEGHKGDLSATYLAGVYDHHDSTVVDLVNAPDWLPLQVRVEGELLDVRSCKVISHRRVLDMRRGTLRRDTLFEDSRGRRTRIASLRFASMADRHLCGIKLRVTPENHASRISVESALNAERYNLDRLPAYPGTPVFHPEVKWRKWAKSRHLSVDEAVVDERRAYIAARTLDTGIVIGLGTALLGPPEAGQTTCLRDYERVAQVIGVDAEAGVAYDFVKLAALYTSRDVETARIAPEVAACLENAIAAGFDKALEDSAGVWERKWTDCDCRIAGDEQATRAVRFGIYHMLIAANEFDPRANIGAKSMSGEGYKGHVFWDTEIFLLPFYIFTQPATARALLSYRYHTLPGALQNARDNGFEGAQFAWESADSGLETTPKRTADGVNRIWTGEEEIHVTACVAFGVISYVTATGDRGFLRDEGAEILYQTARFWASRLEWNQAEGRYELRQVIGPDEFHEHVDNNAFTNRMVKWHLDQTVRLFGELMTEADSAHARLLERLGLTESEVSGWQTMADRIYVPFAPEDQLIEQFEGYFGLEDVPISEWDENNMPRYPEGHDHFSLNGTMLLKQPDVVMLTYLLPDEFTAEVKAANFDFYERRTLHKSSLSPAIHAIMGIETGDHARAVQYFERSAYVDLRDNQGNTQDGMHIASAGGTWQALVCGFGGFRVRNGQMTFRPWLPPEWQGIRFRLHWQDNKLDVTISNDECLFLLHATAGAQQIVKIYDEEIQLSANETKIVRLPAPAPAPASADV
jgi:kojibiose phosphorylase